MNNSMKTYGLPALRVALLTLCTAAAVAPLLAQDAPPPTPVAGMKHNSPEAQAKMLKHLTRQLNLTPDQVTQVQAIQADESQKFAALSSTDGTPVKGARRQMMAIRQDEMDRTRVVLNDTQKTKFDTMQAQQREKMQEKRSGGAATPSTPPPPPSL